MRTQVRRLQTKREQQIPGVRSEKELFRALLPLLLNSKPNVLSRVAIRRVIELIADLQRLERIRQELSRSEANGTVQKGVVVPNLNESLSGFEGWPLLSFNSEHWESLNDEGRQLLQKVNRVLSRYSWSPALALLVDDGGFGPFIEHPQVAQHETEKQFVRMLLHLITKGNIDRCRQCRRCEAWFFAATGHQIYCRENCRQRYASASPVFKEKRRDYMRRYRRDDKERELRSRRQLKRK